MFNVFQLFGTGGGGASTVCTVFERIPDQLLFFCSFSLKVMII